MVETGGVSGSLVIGASFIFVVYFLHPAVESSYHRVRAYRAWRAIEKRQTVEVTCYPLMAEVFGGRGRWDAARITAALMVVFTLAACGLELSMGVATYEGGVDILNRPPPVEVVKHIDGANVWKVGRISRFAKRIASKYGLEVVASVPLTSQDHDLSLSREQDALATLRSLSKDIDRGKMYYFQYYTKAQYLAFSRA